MHQEQWTAVDRYITDSLIQSDPFLEATLEANAAAGLPAHDVAPNQGKLLHLFARMLGARNILEIGTLGAYSTIWLARSLPEHGRLVTLEADPKHAAVAQSNLDRAEVSHIVELRVGPALDSLASLVIESGPPFDLIFIDADKPNNPVYLAYALKLSRKGTLNIGDNVVRDGAVVDSKNADPRVQGVRRFFDLMAAEPRLSATATSDRWKQGLRRICPGSGHRMMTLSRHYLRPSRNDGCRRDVGALSMWRSGFSANVLCWLGWRSMGGTLGLLLVLALSICSEAQPTVLKLTIHDTIQPVTAQYIARGLHDAAKQQAAAVLLTLGTPGGLLSSTRDIVASIESSPVPVIVYISPSGSRAGSAGFFLLEAADIAAMAPGTNAGASHPIVEGRALDPILKEKIENDTAAFLRSFTTRRNRNVTAAEDAVRNSKSYSDTEALDLKLIDLIAPDDTTLLRQLDGRTIRRFDGTAVTLHLTNATIVTDAPSTRERLLTRLASPDFAVLLMVVGGLLIYLEFNVPGTIVPGALGTLLVLLGAFGLNLLPVRHTAVALLVAAVVMIVLEAKFSSHGVLATVGIACLIFGLATLVDAPIAELRVHLSTAIAAGLGFGGISFFLALIARRARRNKVLTGPAAMLRQIATVVTPLTPTGQVEVRGELWQARLSDATATLPPGAQAQVDAIDGLTLLVAPVENQ